MKGRTKPKRTTRPGAEARREPSPPPMQILRDPPGPIIARGCKEIDGREWVTSVAVPADAPDRVVRNLLEAEFARGHRWLKDGAKATLPLPEKVNVLVNVFTYSKQVGADAFSWCCGVGPELAPHPRVGNVMVSYCQGYPTDKMRNGACAQARRDGYHLLCMVDDDQKPDLLYGVDPEALPFLSSSLNFILAHDGPALVGAPYCSSPPAQHVLVMKNREYAPDHPTGTGLRLDKYTRDEASVLTGIRRVLALPTGCLLIDLRVFDVLPPPWFAYEFDDAPLNTRLASTEDIVFTRNMDWLGVPQYANWSAWAGHDKRYMTGKPQPAPVADLPDSIYKAWSNGWRPKQQIPVS